MRRAHKFNTCPDARTGLPLHAQATPAPTKRHAALTQAWQLPATRQITLAELPYQSPPVGLIIFNKEPITTDYEAQSPYLKIFFLENYWC